MTKTICADEIGLWSFVQPLADANKLSRTFQLIDCQIDIYYSIALVSSVLSNGSRPSALHF